MNPDAEFWRGRKVLVTGHTGFKGSWLSLWLQDLGAVVCGYALKPATFPCVFEEASVARGMESIIGDVRDGNRFGDVVAGFDPSVVLHLAAQPLVRRSYRDPIETYGTNVMGVLNVLEAVRNRAPSARAIVNVTSDKCYENREWHWGYRESDALGGHDPYSSSKGCAEILSAAYRRSFLQDSPIALATARAGNVIGGGDWSEDRLLPDILGSLSSGKPVIIRNPDSVRPWQHVLEPLSAYMVLAEKLAAHGHAFAESWNIGPVDSDAKSVQWIADKLVELWGAGASWVHKPDGGPHEATYLKLDCSKIAAVLGWRPRWNLDAALTATVEWHRHWINKRDMKSVCLEQIRRFTNVLPPTA